MDEPGLHQRYVETELILSRAFRLPGKAALDRRIGDIGVRAAEIISGRSHSGQIGGEVIELEPVLQLGDTIRKT